MVVVAKENWLTAPPLQPRLPEMSESTEEKLKRAHRLLSQLSIDVSLSEQDRDALLLAATIVAEARCEVTAPPPRVVCDSCGHAKEAHNLPGLGDCFAPRGGGLCQCRKFVPIGEKAAEARLRETNSIG